MTRDKESLPNTILWMSVRIFMNVVLVFLLVEGFYGGYQFADKLFGDYPYAATSDYTINLTINEGDNAMTVANNLAVNEIVDGKYLFLARVYLGKYHNQIKPGTYKVGPGMSPDEICREICGIKSEDAS